MTKQDSLQLEFIQKGVEFYNFNCKGYLDLAMRFGKCRITIEMLKKLYDYDATVLIAYPDNKLKETWQSECILWKYNNQNITYVNFSSLKKYTQYEFDFIVVD